MIDTGINEAYYGAVLVCVECFIEAATRIPELGLMRVAEHLAIIRDMASVMGRANNLEPAMAQLQLDLDSAMGRARSSLNQPSNNDLPSIPVPDRIPVNAELNARDGEADQQSFFSISELLRTATD